MKCNLNVYQTFSDYCDNDVVLNVFDVDLDDAQTLMRMLLPRGNVIVAYDPARYPEDEPVERPKEGE